MISLSHSTEIKRAGLNSIITFSDDRDVKKLNDNFKRLREFGIVENDFNVRVATGASITTVTFNTQQINTNYGIMMTTTWNSWSSILSKTTTGFLVLHSSPTTTDQKLDWIIIK